MFADLHLHSSFSDGTFSPEEIVVRARSLGVGGLSLTDHDTVEGCERMRAACASAGIEFVSGTELTAEQEGDEIHLLGYGMAIDNPLLLSELAHFQQVRQNRIREMVARLNSIGVPLAEEAVFALANCRAPGRPHVARALVQAGYCLSLDEAFERYLKKQRRAWVPKFKMSARQAIDLIHQAGGVAVVAHPGLNKVDGIIPDLVASGLDGLECFHTKHSQNTSDHYLAVAHHYRLLTTGGSDCHGMSKGKPLLGTVKVPMEHFVALRQRLAQRDSPSSLGGAMPILS